ncbi:hypothetical protein ARMGADRAFT_351727 [Armillaria gallica]|uniref:Uncharacterized protein n=1 Tax=Armillaria gallica TaxID=47427 RepID=A0A2H3DCG0_ARMGA|nr:hypothetical protein ARMGADRAFT_351727 [Armillaria gallica]
MCHRDKIDPQRLGVCETSIRDILTNEKDIIVLPISGNSSCPDVSLKIFREGLSDYAPITQSASEDQDMPAAPQGGPSNIADPESQDTSNLSGLQLEESSAMSVEDYYATAEEEVGKTVEPNEPSEWMSRLIDGIDIVKSVIDECAGAHPAASIAWIIISPCINVSTSLIGSRTITS